MSAATSRNDSPPASVASSSISAARRGQHSWTFVQEMAERQVKTRPKPHQPDGIDAPGTRLDLSDHRPSKPEARSHPAAASAAQQHLDSRTLPYWRPIVRRLSGFGQPAARCEVRSSSLIQRTQVGRSPVARNWIMASVNW